MAIAVVQVSPIVRSTASTIDLVFPGAPSTSNQCIAMLWIPTTEANNALGSSGFTGTAYADSFGWSNTNPLTWAARTEKTPSASMGTQTFANSSSATEIWGMMIELSGMVQSAEPTSPEDAACGSPFGGDNFIDGTIPAGDAPLVDGEIMFCLTQWVLSSAATHTSSHAYSAGTKTDLGDNDATSTVNHWRLSYALLSGVVAGVSVDYDTSSMIATSGFQGWTIAILAQPPTSPSRPRPDPRRLRQQTLAR